jgi:hypothetical protein
MESDKVTTCFDCGKIKEVQRKGYCNACSAIRCRQYRERLKAGHIPKKKTIYCRCGDLKKSGQSYCQPCITKQSREWRQKNGFSENERKRIRELQNLRWRKNHPIKDPIRKKGSLINGKPVNCIDCDRLSEGWCLKCQSLYERLKDKYQNSNEYNLKHKVRSLTRSYIKAGFLAKEPCEICGTNKKVEAHHDDYTKPMDIRWLCKKHHDELHLTRSPEKPVLSHGGTGA